MGGYSKRLVWTESMDAFLKKRLQAGATRTSITEEMGLHRCQVLRRIKHLGITPENLAERESTQPQHIIDFKRKRRGFHVPEHKELEYYDLLKKGVSIDEACKRLKIKKD